jgi:2-alkyl-3-oxoalkanoate reductase
MRVLVTGASGFIGRHVVAALLERGHEVRAVVRQDPKGVFEPRTGLVDVARADLGAGESALEPLFEGVTCLVHLASALRGTDAEQRTSTVEGTRRLLEAMSRTATRRIVLASSFAVYDWSAIDGVVNERSPLLDRGRAGLRGPYPAAKVEQEQLTRRMSTERGWDLTVLRPGFVWGRGVDPPACLGMDLRLAFLVVGPLVRPCLSYVENCADLFAAAALDSRAVGRTFNVVDGQEVSAWRHARNHFFLSGPRRVCLPVPYVVGASGARFASAVLSPLLPRVPSVLLPGAFQGRFRPVRADAGEARKALGWSPPWAYEEALRRSFGEACERRARQGQDAGQ